MESAVAVRASDLSLHYPGERRGARGLAVDGVSFTIPRGGVLGVIGEAGSGKSTLARAVAGLADLGTSGSPEICGGELSVLGVKLRRLHPRRRDGLTLRVGYLPQDGGSLLDPHLTVGENVAEPIFVRDPRFDRHEAGVAAATLIDAVHLPLGLMPRFPHEISRGQRQRVALARALVLEPDLLVADDPTMGVDLLVRGAILDVVGEIRRERELSALIIAHELGELRRVTDRIAVMHRGQFVGLGAIDEVLDQPHHPYVQRMASEYRRRPRTASARP